MYGIYTKKEKKNNKNVQKCVCTSRNGNCNESPDKMKKIVQIAPKCNRSWYRNAFCVRWRWDWERERERGRKWQRICTSHTHNDNSKIKCSASNFNICLMHGNFNHQTNFVNFIWWAAIVWHVFVYVCMCIWCGFIWIFFVLVVFSICAHKMQL